MSSRSEPVHALRVPRITKRWDTSWCKSARTSDTRCTGTARPYESLPFSSLAKRQLSPITRMASCASAKASECAVDLSHTGLDVLRSWTTCAASPSFRHC
eukprot:5526382-Amphidinium_carterae.4